MRRGLTVPAGGGQYRGAASTGAPVFGSSGASAGRELGGWDLHEVTSATFVFMQPEECKRFAAGYVHSIRLLPEGRIIKISKGSTNKSQVQDIKARGGVMVSVRHGSLPFPEQLLPWL